MFECVRERERESRSVRELSAVLQCRGRDERLKVDLHHMNMNFLFLVGSMCAVTG